jgi:tetratricopeptide (TPR) repeat protein
MAMSEPTLKEFLCKSRAESLARTGRYRDAAADFARAADLGRNRQEADHRESIRAKPDDAGLRNNFGDWLLHQDRLTEAETEVRTAIKINPKLAPAHCTFGKVLHAADKRTEAEAEFSEAIRLDPKSVGTHFAMSHAYAHGGEWDKAVTAIGRAVELSPRDYWARLYRAGYALAGNDVEAYRRTCAESLKLFREGNDPDALNVTIRACVLAPDAVPDSAVPVELMRKVVKDHPHAWMLFALGMAHFRAGQFSDALARLEEAIKAGPEWTHNTCVTGLALALVHHRLGHKEEAREWLDRTVEQLEWGTQVRWPAGHIPAHEADWITCVILRKEAEGLIGKAAVKTGTQK